MSNYDKKLKEAREIIDAATRGGKSIEELLDEKVNEIRNMDLVKEVKKYDHFDALTDRLSKEEKAALDEEVEEVAGTYEDMLSKIADVFKDPKNREAIAEEFLRRLG